MRGAGRVRLRVGVDPADHLAARVRLDRGEEDLVAGLGVLGHLEADPELLEPVGRDRGVARPRDAHDPLGDLLDRLVERLPLDLALAERVRLEAGGEDVLGELDGDGRRLGVVALVRDAHDHARERAGLPFAGLERDVGDGRRREGHGDTARQMMQLAKHCLTPLDGNGDVFGQ